MSIDDPEVENEDVPASTQERVIALDTETTGRSHAQGDRIVEIGCVELIGNLETGRTYHTYLNPAPRMVEEGAREVHGLTDQFLADKPKFRAVFREFLDFIGNSPLVIHNAAFDMGFLNKELELLGKPKLSNEVRDTLRLARLKWPGQRATLDALCLRLSVDKTGRALHGALIDASLLAQVYVKMAGLDRLALGDDSIETAAAPIVMPTIAIPRSPRPPRPALLPTPEESAAFQAFLEKSVKDSIWSGIH